MHANECRHTIQIQQKSVSLDDYGQQVNTWTTLVTTKASIRPARRSEEKVSGGQVMGSLTHTIATRYQSDLGLPIDMAAMRILFNSRVINIVSARILEEKNRWIVFDCIEGSIDGA
jgi:SPP1 family predicted phage head-tail adaptor